MKKKYVEPKIIFISKINKLESIKKWNNEIPLPEFRYNVEVVYVRGEYVSKDANEK